MTDTSCNTNKPIACTLRQLTKEEIISIYTTHSVRHFPANERKPVASVERMSDEGIYIGYGLYSKEQTDCLLCYGFFTVLPGQKNILLDYFAVLEEHRNLGIGSHFLAQMKASVTEYDGFLIESEDPDYAADEEELAIRRKRLSFYEKNNATFTGIRADVFDVHYCLLYFPILKQPDIQILYSDFCEIYRHMVSEINYQNKIHIFLPKKEEQCHFS